MRPRSSSTSSSSDGLARADTPAVGYVGPEGAEADYARPDGGWPKRWRPLGWALLWLLVLDVAVNIVFAYPADVRNVNPGKLQLFFDYGRSMEGRLRRMTRADPAQTAPITLAGWYRPLKAVERPAKPGGDIVTIYGMSHAVRLAEALQRVSPDYSARSVGAPGATTNWAFGAFRRDTGRSGSKAVVLAIMSSTLPMITSMTPMTWNESFPLPYTQDRYVLTGGKLGVIEPPYDSYRDYVATLADRAKWAAAVRTIGRADPFYDPWLLDATPLDHSVLVRMARRAWSNRRDREEAGAVLSARSFNPHSEAVRLANAIVVAFAENARRSGQLPVIYIVNNYGYGDQLTRALRATLERNRIPFLASDAVVDPNDPANYLPDTHFTETNDERLAAALEGVIAASSGGGGSAQPSGQVR